MILILVHSLLKVSPNYNIKKKEADLFLKRNPGDVDIIFTPFAKTNKGLHQKIYIKVATLEPIISALKISTKGLPSCIIKQSFSFATNLTYLNQELLCKGINFTINKVI